MTLVPPNVQKLRPLSNSYTTAQWEQINAVGTAVDADLAKMQVGLWMGGEPTFVAQYAAKDSHHHPEWHVAAIGDGKRQLAGQLWQQLERRIAPPGSLRYYNVGKCYPGEVEPRWALGCYWRFDGQAVWHEPNLLIQDGNTHGQTIEQAAQFIQALADSLDLPQEYIIPVEEADHCTVVGYLLPLLCVEQASASVWSTCAWQLTSAADVSAANDVSSRDARLTAPQLIAAAGTNSIGLRLPLNQIAWCQTAISEATSFIASKSDSNSAQHVTAPNSIQVALTVEIHAGNLQIFIPPISSTECFLDLIAQLETTAQSLGLPIQLTGYLPSDHGGLTGFQITPDPGVIEVNIHPIAHWPELVSLHEQLYAAATECGLTCQKIAADGLPTDTGGGAHITIGGRSVEHSPILRRPDLLRSLITYWQHHPGLSYLFSSLFVGPTSQSPRVDETHIGNLYELALALQHLHPDALIPPELLDRLLKNLLVDLSGNTHRTEICIDKLFSPHSPQGTLGVVEFRGFTMPPTMQMRLVQLLLVRSLVAWLWQAPYLKPLKHWGTQLHDRFFLPQYIIADMQSVVADLNHAGYPFELNWLQPFWEFRFPKLGHATITPHPEQSLELVIHRALELWPVLADSDSSGNSRPVDTSMERIQLTLQGHGLDLDEYHLTCNGRNVHFASIGDQRISGVRFRARSLLGVSDNCQHTAITPHVPFHLALFQRGSAQPLGTWRYDIQQPERLVHCPVAQLKYPNIPQPPEQQLQQTREPLITLDLRWDTSAPFS